MEAKKIISVVAAALGLCALAGLLGTHYFLHRPGPSPGLVVRVPEGYSARRIGFLLEAKGIVRSSAHFNLALRFPARGHLLRAGLYEIPPGTSLSGVIKSLTGGPTAVLRVTIPEGAASWEIAETLYRMDLVSSPGEFLAVVEEESLEGFLFPDTYLVPSDFSPAGIAGIFTRNFEKQWQPGWDDRAMRLGMSRREIVTLASIIEREANRRLEKRMVSSVFHNRLRRNMPLQACPTVLYAVGSWRVPLTRSMILETKSPYNTYLSRGLPPGPISNPGRQAIEAALFPPPSDYLFFVSNRDGSHSYSRTYREHNAAIRLIRARTESEESENNGQATEGQGPGNGDGD